MKQVIVISVALCMAVFVISRCSTEKASVQSRKAIAPPFENITVQSDVFKVDPANGAELNYKTGTKIVVPANCFVDESGNAITSEVQVEYKEFHNAADIITAGITMQYDSAGISYNFETAGMFEIHATASNKPVFVAKDKNIKIDFATQSMDESYNFYYLDTIENRWKFVSDLQTSTPANTNETTPNQTITAIKPPVRPQAYNPDDYTFDLDVNYEQHPELKDFSGIMWQYAGTGGTDDPRNNPWVTEQHWNNIVLEADPESYGYYLLTVSNSQRTFNTVVKPVLRGRALKKAEVLYAQKLEEYKEALTEASRRTQELQLLNSFNINKMGVYNCDRLYGINSRAECVAFFDFGKSINLETNTISVFLITSNNRAVIQYYPSTNGCSFAFDYNADNKLIAVLPGNQVAVLSSDDFKSIDYTQFTDAQGKQFTFKLTPVKEKIATPDDFNRIVASLD